MLRMLIIIIMALGVTTTANAEEKLFKGVSSYYLFVVNQTMCNISEELIRSKALVPLSYSKMIEKGDDADIWIELSILGVRVSGSDSCYGTVSISSNVTLSNIKIPFNDETNYAEIPLYDMAVLYNDTTPEGVLMIAESLVAGLVTIINLDNK